MKKIVRICALALYHLVVTELVKAEGFREQAHLLKGTEASQSIKSYCFLYAR